MLSKFDIEREIGKGICLYPLSLDNIKENSINLCAGEITWATSTKEIYYYKKEYDKNKRFSLVKKGKHIDTLKIKNGESSTVKDDKGNSYIILLPLSTTLIETKEVLSLSNYIGGTYHSKVGLVSTGIGHIGTMVGPNFSGDSLIAIHNVTKKLIVLKVGDSFVSVVFHYLDTPYTYLNPTISGHTDKLSQFGLHVSQEQSEELNQDWKKSFDEVNKKMLQLDEYKKLQEDLQQRKKTKIKKFFNKKNITILLCTVAGLIILYFLAKYVDSKHGNTVWVDRYFNVGCSGVFISIISSIINHIKNNYKK